MRPSISVGHLSEKELTALEARYRQPRDANERTRCQIILLSHDGLSPPAIAQVVRRTPQGVRLVIHRYRAKGLEGLRDRRYTNPGRQREVNPEWEPKLLEAVEQNPRQLGVNRASWTAPVLAEYLARETGVSVGEERVRYYLHRHGYAPRRPTWTVAHLARRDAECEAKRGS